MAQINKMVCDVCKAEHDASEKIERSHRKDGTWMVIGIEMHAGTNDSDWAVSRSFDVCDRDSCIATGYAQLYEQAGKEMVERNAGQRKIARATQSGGSQ